MSDRAFTLQRNQDGSTSICYHAHASQGTGCSIPAAELGRYLKLPTLSNSEPSELKRTRGTSKSRANGDTEALPPAGIVMEEPVPKQNQTLRSYKLICPVCGTGVKFNNGGQTDLVTCPKCQWEGSYI